MWLIYTLISLAFFTSLFVFSKILTTDSKDQRAFSVIYSFFASIWALLFFILETDIKTLKLPSNLTPYFVLLVACLFYGLFERYRFIIIKGIDISLFSIIMTLAPVTAFIGSSILYNEPLTLIKLIGGALIIIANILVAFDPKSQRQRSDKKYVILAALSSVFLGIAWMLDKTGAGYFGTSTYSILVWFLPIIVIYAPYIKTSNIIFELKTASWKVIALAFLNAAGYYLQLKALMLGEATRVIPIVQASLIFTVLLGIFFLKEKENKLQKIIAGIACFLGVILLSR